MSKRTSSPSPADPTPAPSSMPAEASGGSTPTPAAPDSSTAEPAAGASPPSGTPVESGPSVIDGATPPGDAPAVDAGKPAELGPPAPLTAADLEHALEATQGALISETDARNRAYGERNRVVAALARCALALGFPAWLGQHPATDQAWEPDWRNIVYIRIPGGQAAWHIHDSELAQFSFLDRRDEPFDGHTTEEKYARLAEWRPEPRR